jgi:hypothetical protein
MGRPGTWKKGQSGNPRGRPKTSDDARATFAAAFPKAAETLVALLDSPDEAIRLRAADSILQKHLNLAEQPVAQPAEDQRRRLVVIDGDGAPASDTEQ